MSAKQSRVSDSPSVCKMSNRDRKSPANTPGSRSQDGTSITSAIRIRPVLEMEMSADTKPMLSVDKNEIKVEINTSKLKSFVYDHIFDCTEKVTSESQLHLFNILGMPMIHAALAGYNACLLAYGQTGSGKTYSMMGNSTELEEENTIGIIPRFLKNLMAVVEKSAMTSTITVELSYFELYNEKIYDLLSKQRIPLRMRDHPEFGIFIIHLKTIEITSYEQAVQVLRQGNQRRSKRATVMNGNSSRSHAIVSIDLNVADTKSSRKSKINLVDLAGSERLSNPSEVKQREGISINQALLALRKVVASLADRKRHPHVPYRDSTLTQLLRESLGGNSLTTMLGTVSPAKIHKEETLATLNYMNQARYIVNVPLANEAQNQGLVRELRAQISHLKMQLELHTHSNNNEDALLQKLAAMEQELERSKQQLVIVQDSHYITTDVENIKQSEFLAVMARCLNSEQQREEINLYLREVEMWCWCKKLYFKWDINSDRKFLVTDLVNKVKGICDKALLENIYLYDDKPAAFYTQIQWDISSEHQLACVNSMLTKQVLQMKTSLRHLDSFLEKFQPDNWINDFVRAFKSSLM